MTIYEERQLNKKRMQLYREAAARKLGQPVEHHGNVALNEAGAYVEVNIWVPKSDIEITCQKHNWPVFQDEACSKCVEENPVTP